MGNEISDFFTTTLPNAVYAPELENPMCFEIQENYDSKGRKTGVVDAEIARLEKENENAPCKVSSKFMNAISEARRLEFLRENEPHMDHPEPKVELTNSADILFNGWDAVSTTYLRIIFKSLETRDTGMLKRVLVECFIKSLGGDPKREEIQDMFYKYDEKGINAISLDQFLRFMHDVVSDDTDPKSGLMRRRVKATAEMSFNLTYMSKDDSIEAGFF